MPTTQQAPITVDNLINKLKLLPGTWRINITNSLGEFYIADLTAVDEDCIVYLDLEEVPYIEPEEEI
jgi:hypothetical protein